MSETVTAVIYVAVTETGGYSASGWRFADKEIDEGAVQESVIEGVEGALCDLYRVELILPARQGVREVHPESVHVEPLGSSDGGLT